MVFSDTTNNTGIVQQTRVLMRVDSSQWPTASIVNSVNNWHDMVTGYAIGADRRFQWDDTNHTKLPEGTTDLLTTTSDYSFLTDENGNTILNLVGISVLQNGYYQPLQEVNRGEQDIDVATFGQVTGVPTMYDKIADNIVRLDKKIGAQITAGLKFYFQRTGSYFAATDTTKVPGVPPVLHRGYVIAAAYDGALTLGLDNLQALSAELAKEEQKMKWHFGNRNTDQARRLNVLRQNNR